MSRDEIIRMARQAGSLIEAAQEKDLLWLERFAALVASAEREAWEHRYARLQSLMDVRETQPNKPCCLAEREACAKLCEDAPEPDGADLAERIRARGNVATNDTSQERVDKTSESVHEPVQWGVDWGRAGESPCVSIIKRLPDGRIEVVAVEYGPQRKPLTDEQKVALCKQFPDHLTFKAIHAIEAAHGIKGEA